MSSDVTFYLSACAIIFLVIFALTVLAVFLMNAGKISLVDALLFTDAFQILIWGTAAVWAGVVHRPFGIFAFGLGVLAAVWRTRRTWKGHRYRSKRADAMR